MGHTDPALALANYAQAMRRDEAENDGLRALVEGADWAPMGPCAPGSEAEALAQSISESAKTPH